MSVGGKKGSGNEDTNDSRHGSRRHNVNFSLNNKIDDQHELVIGVGWLPALKMKLSGGTLITTLTVAAVCWKDLCHANKVKRNRSGLCVIKV